MTAILCIQNSDTGELYALHMLTRLQIMDNDKFLQSNQFDETFNFAAEFLDRGRSFEECTFRRIF